jgi:hypothetical protein
METRLALEPGFLLKKAACKEKECMAFSFEFTHYPIMENGQEKIYVLLSPPTLYSPGRIFT